MGGKKAFRFSSDGSTGIQLFGSGQELAMDIDVFDFLASFPLSVVIAGWIAEGVA